MFPVLANTQKAGSVVFNAGEALTGLEGYFVKPTDGGSIMEFLLPEAVSDECPYLVVDGNGLDEDSTAVAMQVGDEYRCRLNGTVSAGARLVLDTITGANIGKAATLPATEGVYWSPGIAIEDGVDEQWVKFIYMPRLVHVGAAFSAATPAATATTNSSPYGFATQAQGDAVVSAVRDLYAWAVANGFKASA